MVGAPRLCAALSASDEIVHLVRRTLEARVELALPCQHVFRTACMCGKVNGVSRRVLVGVRVFTTLLVAAVVGAADWSVAAASDPARILFLGPRGVLEAADLAGDPRFPIGSSLSS